MMPASQGFVEIRGQVHSGQCSNVTHDGEQVLAVTGKGDLIDLQALFPMLGLPGEGEVACWRCLLHELTHWVSIPFGISLLTEM